MRARGTFIFVGTALVALLTARRANAATAMWAATNDASWSHAAPDLASDAPHGAALTWLLAALASAIRRRSWGSLG